MLTGHRVDALLPKRQGNESIDSVRPLVDDFYGRLAFRNLSWLSPPAYSRVVRLSPILHFAWSFGYEFRRPPRSSKRHGPEWSAMTTQGFSSLLSASSPSERVGLSRSRSGIPVSKALDRPAFREGVRCWPLLARCEVVLFPAEPKKPSGFQTLWFSRRGAETRSQANPLRRCTSV